MKTLFTVCGLLLASTSIFAQKTTPAGTTFYVNINSAYAGTGDVYGFSFAAGMESKAWGRGLWNNELMTTMHDDEVVIRYPNYAGGNEKDGSLRMSAAGVQLNSMLGYPLIEGKKFRLSAHAGPLLRFQTSSFPSMWSIQYPQLPNRPEPSISFEQYDPMRTFAVGGIGKIGARFTLPGKLFIEAQSAFQADSNGDNFVHFGLGVGSHFQRLRS